VWSLTKTGFRNSGWFRQGLKAHRASQSAANGSCSETVTRPVFAHSKPVAEAPEGSKALEISKVHEGPIHLLLTDTVMPETGGSELAAGLASLRPATKVLFMSGYTDDAVVRHGVLSEGTAFLQKPFTPETLVRKVREVLEG
jgi:two-component system, cell cycle sensor histidine kinase and response regulator CckA